MKDYYFTQKDYVDNRIQFIQTYQPFDGRTIRNTLFEEAKSIIVFCKEEGNLSYNFEFDTRFPSWKSNPGESYKINITFSSNKEFILNTSSGWYVTGFKCVL